MEQSLNSVSSSTYFASEQECADTLSPSAAQQGYHSNTIAEHNSRDENLAPGGYSVTETHGGQFLAERPTLDNQNRFAPHTTSYVVGDSSEQLSATTPTSSGALLAHSFTQPYQINSTQGFYTPQTFGSRNVDETNQSYIGWRADPTAANPVSPSVISREQYTFSSAQPNLVHSSFGYASSGAVYPSTPRIGDPSLVAPYTPATSLHDSSEMPSNVNEQSYHFPFGPVEHLRSIENGNGELVRPNIHVRATKGFFTAQGHWTCYRRNYFGLNAWYDLGLLPHNTPLYLEGRQIKAFAMHLSASIEGQEGKAVELVQYTPKRDLGDKTAICTTKVAPSYPTTQNGMGPGGSFMGMTGYQFSGQIGVPYLPLQHERESESPESPAVAPAATTRSRFAPQGGQNPTEAGKHSFDRVQFKGATQNNGKRRASQQFYVLVVELLADVRADDAKAPDYKRVACRPSEKLVVRGRSPSHYKDSDGRLNGGHAGRGGNQGNFTNRGHQGSSGGSQGGSSSFNPGSNNTGAFRPAYPYSSHSSLSPTNSFSATSPSSNEDSITDNKHAMEPSLTREQLSQMQNYPGYRYIPDALLSGTPVVTKLESPIHMSLPRVSSLDRTDSKVAIAEDYPGMLPDRHWNHGTYSAYLGSDTSRGWYSQLQSGSQY